MEGPEGFEPDEIGNFFYRTSRPTWSLRPFARRRGVTGAAAVAAPALRALTAWL